MRRNVLRFLGGNCPPCPPARYGPAELLKRHTHIHHSMPFCMAGQFRCPTHHQEQYESSKDIVNEICVHWISTATKICNQVLDAILCLLDALNLAYMHGILPEDTVFVYTCKSQSVPLLLCCLVFLCCFLGNHFPQTLQCLSSSSV